ncbi:hypothetical protein EYD45_05300 [Hyunsoonleella flava]|uniref:peptidylprolyl isomerase n=1 Tax=Hyunsoonleella flava TaxID=2527939 RepID=A0A4Q9FFS7_9FLAO|nr:hypothetical protein [Hyunsoonleella flava]TBN04680.1 hypothetical protein EYD45_05300 [Hyunsoonleella flava]
MSLRKIGSAILVIVLVFMSCNNDDGGVTIPEIILRDRAEQQIVDKDSIDDYLSSHYFNKSMFEGNTNPKTTDLVITKITDETISSDADSLLINAVGDPIKVTFVDVEYEYYVLSLNQGGGDSSPNFADNILITYEGFTLDNEVFDSAVTPLTLDLTTLIPGWRKVFPRFNVAESFVENGDGTVSYSNHGAGVMFLPSGLAYFADARTGIPAYSPLIFKFELLQSFVNDHDNDGVPSWKEDIDGDGEFFLDPDDLDKEGDDDTDNDRTPDYVDPDDDGDGVPTVNEDWDGDGDPTNDMSPINPSLPRYLDPEANDSK